MDQIVARLEGLVARITGGAGDDGEGTPVSVSEYDSYYTASVQPFIDACNKFPETKQMGTWTETAFKHTRNVIEASTQCKKPADMMAFLGPIVTVITDAQKIDNRSPFVNQFKAYELGIQCLNFLVADGPKAICQAQLEAADFYLNKALMGAKDKEDPEKTNIRAFVSGMKKMIKDLGEYCNDFHKTGVMWKFSGADVKDYKPGQKAGGSEEKKGTEAKLEGICEQLEAYAAKMSGGGEDGPLCVSAYTEYYDSAVKPFVEACNKAKGCAKIGAWTEKAFTHLGVVIKASTECKKPDQAAFMKFLGPIVEVITEAGNPDNKAETFNHEQSFFEAIQSLNFVCMEGGPKGFIMGQLESGSMYSNRVLMKAKDMEDPMKSDQRAWVAGLKKLLTDLAEYGHEHFRMGLLWNAKGVAITEFKA